MFASSPDAGIAAIRPILFILALLPLAACAPAETDFGIELRNLRAETTSRGMRIRAQQQVRLSPEARTALRHGVPLRIRLDIVVSARGEWNGTEREPLTYEIRYLPLSERYQLTGPGPEAPQSNYPRLRHVLAALREVEIVLGDAPRATGPVEIRMRSRLDRSGMPGPMQLPVLLSSQWRHDSGWVSEEFPRDS